MGLSTGIEEEIARRKRVTATAASLGRKVVFGQPLSSFGSAPTIRTPPLRIIPPRLPPGPAPVPTQPLSPVKEDALSRAGLRIPLPGNSLQVPFGTGTGGIMLPMDDIWQMITERLLNKFLPSTTPMGPGIVAQEPVIDRPFIPNVIDRMFGGTLPRGAVAPVTGPNGLPDCPRGYHFNKAGQPWCVRNRRMNPLNPRALSRASRRIGGFARAVKRARTIKRVVKSL